MKEKINVHGIATLAKLRLDNNEADRLEKEMLQFAEFACILDVSDTENYSHSPMKEYGTSDKVSKTQTDISQFANSVLDGYITVPLTVEGE